ncbi:MAG: YgiQ family radical SAM protein [Sphaerochaetaceae bacterium]|nr:YgiQ family radical SAM protein [Sphaerochaetaceae bacterium]
MVSRKDFLPTSKLDLQERKIKNVDILFITGDAYVDHPTFAAALLGRLLEHQGYTVGIIAQPRWDCLDDFIKLGSPNLCVMISAGNIDSMVCHYTSALKIRSQDAYSPGGKAGYRPDRALITYCMRAKQAFKDVPIIIGGIEGSLRRFAHYDYWQDKVRKSILFDSKADLLVYGMGENQTLEIAKRLKNGENIKDLTNILGTAYLRHKTDIDQTKEFPQIFLPSFEEVSERDIKSNTPTEEGKKAYALAFQKQEQYENPFKPVVVVQNCMKSQVIENPPALPLTEKQMDSLYNDLFFTRLAHPDYEKDGGIPGLNEVQFSITCNRGCFGGCSFCAITAHQGRIIQARSTASVVKEAKELSKHPNFKGYIHDIGGPTANFLAPSCDKQLKDGPCSNRQCLFPTPCPNIKDSHEKYLEMLDQVKELPGIKKVFIRSGIRFDYLMLVAKPEMQRRFLDSLVKDHVSGQLRIAPEHVVDEVLEKMGKCPVSVYEDFVNAFNEANKKAGKKQYVLPYLISSHPGSTLKDAIELSLYLKKHHFIPEQVQEFYPTPGSASTCMYYTGLDPRLGKNFEKVYVPKGREKHLQRALLQFNRPENRHLVIEALVKEKREDLIPVLLGK